jgi:hypothetical protein
VGSNSMMGDDGKRGLRRTGLAASEIAGAVASRVAGGTSPREGAAG